MRNRRIQTITTQEDGIESNFGTIPGVGITRIWTNMYKFIGPGKTAKFALRPFAGSTKIEFHMSRVLDTPLFIGTVKETDEKSDIYLCPSKSRKILGIGKSTKKFSIWYKRA